MHEVLVNGLGGLSLPKKSVVRLTDRMKMTIDVYHGRKTTTQQQQQLPPLVKRNTPRVFNRINMATLLMLKSHFVTEIQQDLSDQQGMKRKSSDIEMEQEDSVVVRQDGKSTINFQKL